MSDGAEESIEGDNLNSDFNVTGAHEFVREVSKVAVAQICENVGFQSCHESAIDEFAEIALRYISDLALASVSSANSAGRTQCNVFDLFNGMKNLPRTLGVSDILGQISQYSDTMDELPFSRPIPHFPILQNPSFAPNFSQILEIPPGSHVPPWLPAFPDPHTYIYTPIWTERNTNLREDKIEQAKQRRKAEKSLLKLQKRLPQSSTPETSDHPSTSVLEMNKFLKATTSPSSPELPDRHEQTSTATGNQFLLPPSKEGINVSEIVLPARFAESGGIDLPPLHHECEMNGICHESELERRPLPEKRGKVQFRFVSGKRKKEEKGEVAKKLCKNSTVVKMGFSGNENMKRRAEATVRESVENSSELT